MADSALAWGEIGQNQQEGIRGHLIIYSLLHGHIHTIRDFPHSQSGSNSLNTFNMNISVYKPETEHQIN